MMASVTDRARSYIARMPASLQGSGGSTALFNVARVLAKGFSLSEGEAFALLAEWQTVNAVPPWSEPEMRHKLKDAAKLSGPSGYLLGDSGGGAHAFAGGGISYEDTEARKKEELRKGWPAFRTLSPETMRQIADLRRVSLPAVELLHRADLLRGAVVDGHRCFIIREGRFAQARRIDGGMLTVWKEGKPEDIKAKNLPGSQGAFLGRKWLGSPDCPALLVEGAVALLEAVSAALSVNADVREPHGFTIVAACSAGSRFTDEWLHRLKNRRVRIVPDRDAAGREACSKWSASLRGAGCTVDAVPMPEAFKDLGEAMRSPDFPAIAAELFTL